VKKPGRPTKYSDELTAKIVDLATKTENEEELAHLAGISPRTLYYWKTRHAAFLQMMLKARGTAVKLVEVSLFQRAIGYSHPETQAFCNVGTGGEIRTIEVERHYPPDTKAAVEFLARYGGKRWRKFKATEYPELPGEEPDDVRNLSDDDLIKELKLLKGGKK
jgi:hypothetical protein